MRTTEMRRSSAPPELYRESVSSNCVRIWPCSGDTTAGDDPTATLCSAPSSKNFRNSADDRSLPLRTSPAMRSAIARSSDAVGISTAAAVGAGGRDTGVSTTGAVGGAATGGVYAGGPTGVGAVTRVVGIAESAAGLARATGTLDGDVVAVGGIDGRSVAFRRAVGLGTGVVTAVRPDAGGDCRDGSTPSSSGIADGALSTRATRPESAAGGAATITDETVTLALQSSRGDSAAE